MWRPPPLGRAPQLNRQREAAVPPQLPISGHVTNSAPEVGCVEKEGEAVRKRERPIDAEGAGRHPTGVARRGRLAGGACLGKAGARRLTRGPKWELGVWCYHIFPFVINVYSDICGSLRELIKFLLCFVFSICKALLILSVTTEILESLEYSKVCSAVQVLQHPLRAI